jgi:hypothetical protein
MPVLQQHWWAGLVTSAIDPTSNYWFQWPVVVDSKVIGWNWGKEVHWRTMDSGCWPEKGNEWFKDCSIDSEAWKVAEAIESGNAFVPEVSDERSTWSRKFVNLMLEGASRETTGVEPSFVLGSLEKGGGSFDSGHWPIH